MMVLFEVMTVLVWLNLNVVYKLLFRIINYRGVEMGLKMLCWVVYNCVN